MTDGDPSILEKALEESLRAGREYGPPAENFPAAARLLDAYLMNRVDITMEEALEGEPKPFVRGEDFPLMMALVKIARLQTGDVDRDTVVDIAGYVRAFAEMHGLEELDYDG